MFTTAASQRLAKESLGVDLVAKRIIKCLTEWPPNNVLAASTSFHKIASDDCSFEVFVHRKRLAFVFSHALAPVASGMALAGRFDIFTRIGDDTLVLLSGGIKVFPPTNLLFDDGTTFSLSENPDGNEAQDLQLAIALAAQLAAQAVLPKF